MSSHIRVLVVDDSAIVRKVISETLSREPDIEVIATAPDPIIAKTKIEALKPDVLTLDIEMPRKDGLSFLRELMRERPMPVIVVSSLVGNGCAAALTAMECGAVEVMAKPGGPYSVGELQASLAAKVRAAARARVAAAPCGQRESHVEPRPAQKALVRAVSAEAPLVAIGASTGGTEAIRVVLQSLPADCPPIVIVQHIPPVFSRAFADRLDQICPMHVREAKDGDTLERGLALIAPGDFHMLVRKAGTMGRVEVKTGPRVCYQRPSVDVLFRSVAAAFGRRSIGVLLTGMGDDGAAGLAAMRDAGAATMAQDEASCVVYGMPREAVKRGAVQRVLPLHSIAGAVASTWSQPVRAAC